MQLFALAVCAALMMSAMAALADDDSPLGSPFGASTPVPGTSYTPAVPISPLAHPSGLLSGFLDPSRFKMSTEISFGSGWGGTGMNGLQIMRFGYRFSNPLAMQLSVGNAFGPNTLNGSQNHPFIEGLDLAYHPFKSMLLNVQYRDIRSPLQLGGYGYDPIYGPGGSFGR